MSFAGSADAEMPADFLKVESRAWSRWLDENLHVFWHGIPLRDVLASEFGAAAFTVDDVKALGTPITFDASNMTRGASLWRLSQRYGFTIRWAQKDEPRIFLGLSEAEHREHQVGGVTLTAITQVMRSDYKTYQDLKRRGQVTKEEIMDGILYYAIDVDRDLNFGDAAAHVNEVQRYKTKVPGEAGIEAQFTARVRWIETIGRRNAEVVPIGVDPRWVVGIEILSIQKPADRFDKKGDTILAIHNPVRVFLDDREKTLGKLYEFKTVGFLHDGRPTYLRVEAQEKDETEPK